MTEPHALAVIAWTRSQRPEELARGLDGTARRVWMPRLTRKALVPVRYALSAIATAAFLLRRRPLIVVVQNPPIIPGVLSAMYCRCTGAQLALDSHPRGFGHKGSRAGKLFRPVHAVLMRFAAVTLVASEPLAAEVRDAGGRPLVLHEPPPLWRVTAPEEPTSAPVVLFVGVFAEDEPVKAVLEAAQRLPEVRFDVTGDLARCPPGLRATAPANVRFTGYQAGDAYAALVNAATVLLVLTTESTSVPRAAFEAVMAERPLVLSDHPMLRVQFPEAVAVPNDGASVADGVRSALMRRDELALVAPAVRRRQVEHWETQKRELLGLLDRHRAAIEPHPDR